MSKIDLSIPALTGKFVDLRDSIPGDSYNWSWIRPLSQVNYLAIHHSAGSDTQTPEEIANFHINNNGWGGIGYHFLISKDGTVYYVGDISTARANVVNLNEQVIGICLIGNFTSGKSPTQEQLGSAHKLCEFLINYPPLSNVNSWEAVKTHKNLPGQVTVCPGDGESWIEKIISWREIMFNQAVTPSQEAQDLRSQVDSLQTTLATINQQIIFLQESLVQRDQQINQLKKEENSVKVESNSVESVSIIQALINLYNFIFPRRIES